MKESRLNNILDLLVKYTQGDQSDPLPISEHGDEYDAISVGINTLIEEQSIAMKQLKESEEHIRSLLTSMKDGFAHSRIITNSKNEPVDWEYIYVNPAYKDHTGLSSEETIGKKISEIYPDVLKEGALWLERYGKAALKGESSFHLDYIPFIDKWIEVSIYSPTYKEFAIILKDVTEEQKAKEHIVRSEAKFKKLIESAPDAMVIVDSSGKITDVNSQTENIFGYDRVDLLNKQIEILIPDAIAANHHKHREKYAKKPNVRLMGQGMELAGKRQDGSEFPVEIALSPISTEDGLLISAAIRDITERKKTEEKIKEVNLALQAKQEELQTINQELESFSYSVSHDLRAPLRAIGGFSEILLKKNLNQLDESGQRYLNNIVANASKMGQLIDDILNFSRLGRQTMSVSQIDMTGLFREVQKEILQFGGYPKTIFDLEHLPRVKGDFNLLKQVIYNLVSNAYKYSAKKEAPCIQVGCIKEPQRTFYIRDNGAGFDMTYYDKLFGTFQRLHRESEFEGNGVGLALAKRILKRHDGRIWAESEVGKGATFYFTINEKNQL